MFKIVRFECQYLTINNNISVTYVLYLNLSCICIIVYTFISLCVILCSTGEVFMVILLSVLISAKMIETNNGSMCEELNTKFCKEVKVEQARNKKFIDQKTKEWNCTILNEKCQ